MDISRLKLIAFARDGGPRFSRVALSTVTVLLCLFAAKAYSQPVNDNFANATLISGSTGTVFGITFSATREPGEPIHAGVAGGHSVWYSWVAPDTGTATFDTFGSTYDTVLAAYTGTDLTNLTVLAANDDFFNLQSRVSFDVSAGNTYFVVVDGYRGSAGSYRLNWNLPQSTTNNPPPQAGEIQFSASSYAVTEGTNSRLTITIVYGGGANTPVSVDFSTFDGTAIAGTDYSATSGTRTFNVGETLQTFDVEIKDNAIKDGNRTFGVLLSNPTNAVLNAFSTAVVTIIDDETVPYVSTSGEFDFTTQLYRATENESFPAPWGVQRFNLWDVQGAVITINRLNGSTGKVLVDYSTIDIDDPSLTCFSTNRNPQAVPYCDYYPAFGTLVFLDGQTSTNFLVQVSSDFPVRNGDKFVQLQLSNPRPAPEEDPNLIIPTLGLTNLAQLQIVEVNTLSNVFSIERATYTVQEYQAGINVDVILPFGGGGTVQLSTSDAASGILPYDFNLLAGSDYADPFTRTFPNPTFTDGTANIVNPSDYTPTTVTLTFPANGAGSTRQRVFIPIANDDVVEFNEDIYVYLHDPSQGKSVGSFGGTFGLGGVGNGFANCTILYDDQPAGSADREWNPELVSFTNPPFNPVPGANNNVEAVVVQADQKTLIGGDFTAYNSTPRNRIARVNRDGSLDTTFNPGTGANDFVSDIALYGNSNGGTNFGKIIVVGGFSSFDNIQRNGIARLNPDGSLDTTFSPGAGANGTIRALLILGTGKIVVGGEFTTFNGIPRNGVARLNGDGSLDMAFDPGSGANGTVWALGVDSSTAALQIGAGQFGVGPAEFRTNINTMANSGTITIVFDAECVPDTLHVYYGPILIFDSGPTNSYGGDPNCLGPYMPQTFIIPYGPGPYTDVTIVINEGSGDPGTAWQFDATIENSVLGERVYAGGDFTIFDGLPRSGIVRLSANGPVDQAFDPGGGVDAPVYTVKVQPDLNILIGGAFTDYDFHARNRIARLNENGSIDLSFDPGDGFDNDVYNIKLQTDGKPMVGGRFRSFDHTRRLGIARLFTNGVLDTSFMDQAYNQFAGLVNPFSFEPDNFVNSVAVDNQGGVMIGGSFTNLGGNGFAFTNFINAYWIPNTRQDIVTRYNLARLIGGYTPGPGNMQFSFPDYTVDENAGTIAVTMRRLDGRLGTVQITDSTGDRLATAGEDYIDTKLPVIWPEWFYIAPRSVGYAGPNYFSIPILDDTMIEGDEILNLFASEPSGSITLGGEYVPLGGARGRNTAPLTITDNDFPHGVIAFNSRNYFVTEGTNAVVTLIRTNGSSGNAQVDLYTVDGNALANSDYIPKRTTINFPAGKTNVDVSITIVNDTVVENQEYFYVVLTNVTGGASLPGGLPTSTEVATLNIIDNDVIAGRLNFSTTNYLANEGDNNFLVTVTRTGGNVGALTVLAEVLDGTALAGTDYERVTNSLLTATNTYKLSWNSGDIAPKSFPLRILDDQEVRTNRYFSVRLFNASAANVLQPPTNAIVSIVDNDSYGTLEFSAANYDADENGTNVIITVVRKNGIAGTVSVDYTIEPGSAEAEIDYTTNGLNNPHPLVFGPGELSKSFRIGLIDDSIPEGIETVNLALVNPSQDGLLGSLSNAVLSIIDDESSSIPAGSVDTSFDPLVGPDEPVYTMALQTDGKLLIGGDFTTFNHITRHRVARLMSDGSLDGSFNVGAGPNRPVRTMVLQPDGKAIIGGFFTSITGTNRNHIARLNRDGTVDNFFNPGAGADNPVYALAMLPDGKVVVAGAFTTFNGVPRQGIALLNTNGTLNLNFNPGLGANGVVYALAVQPDGKILLAGDFTRVGLNPYARMARLNADGSVDTSFNPGLGADAPIRALLLQPDGGIVVGGTFSTFNDQPHSYLVRLLGDGTVDSGFYPSAGGNNAVYALAAQPDGKIMVAGDFTSFNGVTRHRLTRLNPNGKTDPTINFGAGANAFITALLVQPDRKIIIGGGFTTVDDQPRNHVARLHGGSIAGPGRVEFAAPDFIAYEGDGSATMVLRRQGGTTGSESVDLMVTPGSATLGADYCNTNIATATDPCGTNTSTPITITFQEGETYQEFHLQILDDTEVEDPETVNLTLVDSLGLDILGEQPTATLTIISDDSVIRFLTPTFTVSENALSGTALITVLRTGATNTTVSVDFKTLDGTATAPADYTAVSDTLTFAPGEVAKSFYVPIINDNIIEGDETVSLILTNATAGTVLAGSQATLTIVDDDFAPGMLNFSSAAYSVNEYETNATITIIRTNGSSGIISVRYATRDGSARAGQDYFSASGQISFADGETIKTFNVPIIPDYITEPNETVLLILSNPTGNASLGPISTATLTIIDNPLVNGSLSFSQTNYSAIESNGVATLSVIRSFGFLGPIGVTYRTIGGSASNGTDFIAVTNTLAWADGESGSKNINITLVNDSIVEPIENFRVVLENPTGGASLGGRTNATVTITDDDKAAGNLGFQFANFTVPENGTNATITVVRTLGDTGTVSIAYSTVTGGTAVSNADYTGVSGTLIFAPGVTSQTFTVPIIDNFVVDVNKTINLQLSNPTGGARTNGQIITAVLTIIENDQPAGSIDFSFNNSGANAQVYALLVQTNNSKLYAAGAFTQFSGSSRIRLARLNPNGALDAGFDAGNILNRDVNALALQSDNKIVAGGLFTPAATNSPGYLLRFNTDGSRDTNFFNGLQGVDNAVYAVTAQPDGKFVIGGIFNNVNGAPRAFLARITSSGALDPVFNPQASADNTVRAIAVQNDGRIVIGGDFLTVNANANSHIARLTQDGQLDATFNIQGGANDSVHALAIQPDGKILVGGSFTNYAGVPVGRIVRLLANGQIDTSFNSTGAGANEFVTAIAIQPDAKILVAGGFTDYNGVTRNSLVRLNADGSLDTTINFGNGANSYISALALQADRKIVIGGAFTSFDGTPRNYIARLNGGDNLGFGSLVFSATNYPVIEGNPVTVSVKRLIGTSNAVSVSFATTGTGTAIPFQHYIPTNGTVTFAPGETVKTFDIVTFDDVVTNADRTIGLTLSSPNNGGTLGLPSTATVTIQNNDGVITFTTPNYTVSENGVNAAITVERRGATAGDASVSYYSGGGSATPNVDYIPVSGTIMFTNGQALQTIFVPILDDTIPEGNETVQLYLQSPSQNYTLGIAAATLTIVDNELDSGTLQFATNNFVVSEQSILRAALVTIVRGGGSSGSASVEYFTSDGSATAPADYSATRGTLVFLDGESSKTFRVPIVDDMLVEGPETINLTLTNATGATLGPNTAVITIAGDETVFSFTNQFLVFEGDPYAQIAVNRSSSGSGPVSVQAFTFDGTATAGLDYVPVATNLFWNAGDTSPKYVIVPIIDDNIGEPDETFFIQLFNPSGESMLDTNGSIATVIIRDNDSSFALDNSSYTVFENGGTLSLNVVRVGLTNTAASVEFFTSDGTATAGRGDYVPVDVVLSFAPGETNQSVTIQINDDNNNNGDRSFNVNLRTPVGANLATPNTAAVTILDDERLLVRSGEFNFSTNIYVCTEWESDIVVSGNYRDILGVMITVNRLGGSIGKVAVDYSTIDDTNFVSECAPFGFFNPFNPFSTNGAAIPFVDYFPTNGTLVFDHLQTSTNFIVRVFPSFFGISNIFSIFNDRFFSVHLSNARAVTNATAGLSEDPNVIVPTIGVASTSCVEIVRYELDGTFNFGRANHRLDERGGTMLVPIYLPAGVNGRSVRFRATQNFTMQPGPIGFFFNNFLNNWSGLEAGSDNAISAETIYPNPTVTDGSATITNHQDFTLVDTTITVPNNADFVYARVPILDDNEVEFNEDIYFELFPLNGNAPVGLMDVSRGTILFDDQPAGAADREWNPENVTNSIPPLYTTPGANNVVHAVAVQDDQKTVIGGEFTAYNTITRRGIARINRDGSQDSTFNPGFGANDSVNTIAIYRAGMGSFTNYSKIVIGGAFSSVDGALRNGVARLNPDGSLDPTFLPGDGADRAVQGVAIQRDGKVVVVGDFSTFNGTARAGVARLNEDGSLDQTFNPGSAANATVWAVGLSDDGTNAQKVVVGGAFSSFNGLIRLGTARLNSDGSVDTSFDPGGGSDGPVYALAVQPDARVIIGGFFTDVDFHSRNSIARLQTNGSIDLTFDPGDGFDSAVYSIVLEADGKPMVGGVFTTFNQTRRLGLARLFTDGLLDTSFLDTAYNQFAGLPNGFSFLPPNFVRSIAFETNGSVMIGGSFTNLGGNFANEINRVPSYTNVWTRQNKVTRYNVARLIGGYTPGPGNTAVSAPNFAIDENSGSLSVTLARFDGRLGQVAQTYVTSDRLALAGQDYNYTSSNSFWAQQGYHDLITGVPLVPTTVGYVGASYFNVSIIDDKLIEGDEIFNLNGLRSSGFVNLGGEIIGLGAARGGSSATVKIVDNDFQHGQIGFSTPNFTIGENNSFATINVVRTNGANGSVSVDYYTRDGTATNGHDYRAVSGTLTFAPGQTNLTFTVPIINDSIVEPLEQTVSLILTNATGGATLPGALPSSFAQSILTIVDDDFPPGYLNFATTNFVGTEASRTAPVTVTRRGGNSGAMTVQVRVTAGTASDPADFSGGVTTLTWTNGDSAPKTFNIPIVDDSVIEPNETINLALINPSVPGSIGLTNTAQVTIIDNDNYGTVEFSRGNYEIEENGTNVTITILRHDGTSGEIGVQVFLYQLPPPYSNATPGLDYSTNLVPRGQVTLGPGVTTATFNIGMINDSLIEGLENIGLALRFPSNCILGYTSNALVSIIDDEQNNIPAGSPDTAFDVGVGPNSAVYNLALQADGNIIIGGEFTSVDNDTRNRLARLNPDGSLDRSYSVGPGVNRPIRALAIDQDGKALIGGLFTRVQGTNLNHIARLDTDGTLDAFFNPGAGADNSIYAITVLPDRRIVVGGSFTTFNGVSRPGVAVLNTNGTLHLGFNPGVGFNGIVYALAPQLDGKMLVGGDFTTVNNTLQPRIARLNADGSLDTNFNAGLGPNAAVRAILVQPDGRVVIGGSFTNVNNAARNYLARLNADGSLDTNFLQNATLGANDSVYSLALQFDGKILVGGDFTRFSGVTRRRITRLNADGQVDPTINFGGGANGAVSAIALQPDREIVIGGSFTRFNDQPHNYVARLYGGSLAGPGAFQFSSATYDIDEFSGQANITVRRTGGTRGQVQVDYSTSDGTATAGLDYIARAGSFTFPEGEVEQSFLVPILQDLDIEPTETVNLRLSNPSPGSRLGLQPTATLNIIDDDSQIGFGASAFSVSESAPSGHATLTVIRSGATNTAVSVDLLVSDGTALNGQDYLSPTIIPLVYAPGETIKTIQIPIISDTNVEGNETVLLGLVNAVSSTSPNSAVYYSISNAVLTIVDDDFAFGILGFSQLQYNTAESLSNAVITVTRTNGTDGIVSIDYTTLDGTAQAPLDYTAVSGTLTFADGETSKSFDIPVIFDFVDEGTETVKLQLSNVRGGATVGLTNATLIISNTPATDGIKIIPAGAALTQESFTPANGVVDSGETVTFNLGLRNGGVLDANSLGATLLSTNGIVAITTSNYYGAVLAGGNTVSRPYQFRVTAAAGAQITVTLRLQDGPRNVGTVGFDMFVGQAGFTFANTNTIMINDHAPATPYPSIIPVSGLNGTVTKVSVTLSNVTHTYPDDIDILLVGPQGESVVLMSDSGSANGANPHPISNVTLTFQDDVGIFLSDSNQIVSGVYQPTNYGSALDFWPSPAPANAPTRTRLLTPPPTDPNGIWQLFVVDDASQDSGFIANGWSVTLNLSGSGVASADLGVTMLASPNQITAGQTVAYTISVTNYGPVRATGIVLTDALDPAMTFVSCQGASYVTNGTNVIITLPTSLSSGAGANVILTARANPANSAVTNTIQNRVTVQGNEVDLNPNNNAVTAKIIVYPFPRVTMLRKDTQSVVLSWSAIGTANFYVEATDQLIPANWQRITNAASLTGGSFNLTISAGSSTNKTRFFRLRSQ